MRAYIVEATVLGAGDVMVLLQAAGWEDRCRIEYVDGVGRYLHVDDFWIHTGESVPAVAPQKSINQGSATSTPQPRHGLISVGFRPLQLRSCDEKREAMVMVISSFYLSGLPILGKGHYNFRPGYRGMCSQDMRRCHRAGNTSVRFTPPHSQYMG